MRLNPNYYTASEKRTYLLIAILLICISSVRLYIHSIPIYQQSDFKRIVPELHSDEPVNNSTQSSQQKSSNKKKPSVKQSTTTYLQHAFPFDPNNIGESELQQMKFPIKGIQNLLKYRAKGGSINTVSQFKRIWGFEQIEDSFLCLLYTSPSPRDATLSRMPSSA